MWFVQVYKPSCSDKPISIKSIKSLRKTFGFMLFRGSSWNDSKKKNLPSHAPLKFLYCEKQIHSREDQPILDHLNLWKVMEQFINNCTAALNVHQSQIYMVVDVWRKMVLSQMVWGEVMMKLEEIKMSRQWVNKSLKIYNLWKEDICVIITQLRQLNF